MSNAKPTRAQRHIAIEQRASLVVAHTIVSNAAFFRRHDADDIKHLMKLCYMQGRIDGASIAADPSIPLAPPIT